MEPSGGATARPDGRRVAIVTGDAAPDLTEDGRALRAALRDRGVDADPVLWTDEAVDWSTYDAALLRSCWNYHERHEAFLDWLDAVSDAGVALLNPGDVVRWNVHKFYLRDLAARGASIPETEWVERGADVDLAAVLDDNGWDEAVVKPAVGTSSTDVWRTTAAAASTRQSDFDALVAAGDVLVQRFAPDVAAGERSLVFFGGRFSHAFACRPADDDFRAHPSFGGTVEPYDPPEWMVEEAASVLRTAGDVAGVDPSRLPYARVDALERDGEPRERDGEPFDRDGEPRDRDRGLLLMELELVEPYLDLAAADGAVDAFADAVEATLSDRN